jgi:hypothetical protein
MISEELAQAFPKAIGPSITLCSCLDDRSPLRVHFDVNLSLRHSNAWFAVVMSFLYECHHQLISQGTAIRMMSLKSLSGMLPALNRRTPSRSSMRSEVV